MHAFDAAQRIGLTETWHLVVVHGSLMVEPRSWIGPSKVMMFEHAVAEPTESYGQQTYGQTGAASAALTDSPPSFFDFHINFSMNSASIPRQAVSSLDAVGSLMA
jgi:hypothetical protein